MREKDYLMMEIEKNYTNEKFNTNTLISIDNYLKVMYFGANEEKFFINKSMVYTKTLIYTNLLKNGTLSLVDLYNQTDNSYDIKSDFDNYGNQLAEIDSEVKTLLEEFKSNGLNNTFASYAQLSHKYITLYRSKDEKIINKGVPSDTDNSVKIVTTNKNYDAVNAFLDNYRNQIVGNDISEAAKEAELKRLKEKMDNYANFQSFFESEYYEPSSLCYLIEYITGVKPVSVSKTVDPRAAVIEDYFIVLDDEQIQLLKQNGIIRNEATFNEKVNYCSVNCNFAKSTAKSMAQILIISKNPTDIEEEMKNEIKIHNDDKEEYSGIMF